VQREALQRLLGHLLDTQEMLAAEARQQLQLYAATLSLPEGLAGSEDGQSPLPSKPAATGRHGAAHVPQLGIAAAAGKMDAAVGCNAADFAGVGAGGRNEAMELGSKKGAIELVQLVMDELWSPEDAAQLELGWELVREEVAGCLDVPAKSVQLGATCLIRGRFGPLLP